MVTFCGKLCFCCSNYSPFVGSGKVVRSFGVVLLTFTEPSTIHLLFLNWTHFRMCALKASVFRNKLLHFRVAQVLPSSVSIVWRIPFIFPSYFLTMLIFYLWRYKGNKYGNAYKNYHTSANCKEYQKHLSNDYSPSLVLIIFSVMCF